VKRPDSAGGFRAIAYTLRKARHSGGFWRMFRALSSRNACKTCAVGMGGQKGGMVNERGSFPEFCKKSVQAIAADLQGGIKEDFWKTYSLPQLRRFSPYDLEHCGRLVQPVRLTAGSQYYEPISWDEAFRGILAQLKGMTPDETFWYFSGRSSNEAGFLLQLLARLSGTNNVNNCSYYCHQASGVGLKSSVGTGTATIELDDLEHADCVFVIGGNPASNHPRLISALNQVRRRGGEVIVINPMVELGLVRFRIPSNPRSLLFGSKIASQYVQLHIGGDLALLTAVAKRVLERGEADLDYLMQYASGSTEWLDHLRRLEWDHLVAASGVDRETIDRIAMLYGRSRRAVFCWTMGITHHVNGVENVQAIANLALLRGMIGRPHAGLLPIRGHSNVQGIGSVGVTPKLQETIYQRLVQHYGLTLPTTPGLDTLACMERADQGTIRAAVCLGGNLYGSNPDATFAGRAMEKLDLAVYLSTTLNTGHAWGTGRETYILPVLARDEEPEPTTQESMFNFVRLSSGGPVRHQGPRSEVQVIAELGEGLLGDSTPIDWRSMRHTGRIREMIAKVVPGYEGVADIDRTKREFAIPGRVLHVPKFPTADGRAIVHCHEIPPLLAADGELRLMTIRSEGQFNTVVYEEEDLYRGQSTRHAILMHPSDLAARRIQPDSPVTVTSATGRMTGVIARAYEDIRAGNCAMYYPEANVLVSRQVDPKSRTPSFKNVLVSVVAEGLEATVPII